MVIRRRRWQTRDELRQRIAQRTLNRRYAREWRAVRHMTPTDLAEWLAQDVH